MHSAIDLGETAQDIKIYSRFRQSIGGPNAFLLERLEAATIALALTRLTNQGLLETHDAGAFP